MREELKLVIEDAFIDVDESTLLCETVGTSVPEIHSVSLNKENNLNISDGQHM